MKHLYLLLLYVTIPGFAQIVNIPDPNFKNELLNYYPVDIDTNDDGEIQVSEAEQVIALQLDVEGPLNLEGISAFSNLQFLTILNTTDLVADINGMPHLTKLWILSLVHTSYLSLENLDNLEQIMLDGDGITTLNLPDLPSLQYLEISNTPDLTSVSIGNSPNLDFIDFSNLPALTQLTSEDLPAINFIKINTTGLTSIDMTKFANAVTVNISDNQLTALDLGTMPLLKDLNASTNQISSFSVNSADAIMTLSVGANNLSSFALNNFVNLQTLNIVGNHIDTLQLSNLPSLTQFYADQNELTALDLSFGASLISVSCSFNHLSDFAPSSNTVKSLSCQNNEMSALNLSNLPALENLAATENNLTSLDVSDLGNLKMIEVQHNQLQTLTFGNNTNVTYADISNNQLTEVDLAGLEKLYYLDVTNNLFSALDFSHQNDMLDEYEFFAILDSNPELISINAKNGRPDILHIQECPNLSFICIDENDSSLLSQLGALIQSQGIAVNSYCTFTPNGNYNTVNGKITYDFNNDGCDAFDTHHPDIKINVTDDSGNSGFVFTNADGEFAFYTGIGEFTATPVLESSAYEVESQTLSFADDDHNVASVAFCVTPIGEQYSPEITILPIDVARPGFDAHYKVIYKNVGNQPLSGNITFGFDDAILDFVAAGPIANAEAPGSISWEYANLLPFESREILLTLNVNSPLESPAVNINDILSYVATISSEAGIGAPLVSTNVTLNQTVVGSYDPNDKTCLEGETISTQLIGEYLHYLIRFQNTGTFYAQNVVVKDVIDTSKFDISTLQLTDSSHPHTTRITGNNVEFIFENIYLPAEQDDEPASHGFVAFKIKTNSTLATGNSISNFADIFFDYNFPVTTEPAVSTFAQLNVGDVEDSSIRFYPNPAKNLVRISADSEIKSIQMFDVQGRLLQTQIGNSNLMTIDVSAQSTGIYFVKTTTTKGSKTEKLVKE